jgi:hypothetical protein
MASGLHLHMACLEYTSILSAIIGGRCVTVKLMRRGVDAARRRGVLGLADCILRHATLNLFRVATEVP